MIVRQTEELKEYMANRLQENVQQLVSIIEEDINANRQEMSEKIPSFISEYQQKHTELTQQNSNLRAQIDKIQLLHDQSKRLEIDLTDKHTALAVEVEAKINQFNELSKQSAQRITSVNVELQSLRLKVESLHSKLQISESIQKFNRAQDYQGKITSLQTQIGQSTLKSEEISNAIKLYTFQWKQMYDDQQRELRTSIEKTSTERSLRQILDLSDLIKQQDMKMAIIQADLNKEQEKLKTPGITDQEVQRVRELVQKKVTQFQLLLNDKSALFEEMYSNALLMINRDKQIIINEEEIIQLKHEIDINILEVEQKTAIINELQELLRERKAQYKQLKKEIRELEAQCEELEIILK